MEETNQISPEETARLEKLTPRPHGLVAGTLEYQEYFRSGTSSLSILQSSQRTKIGKLNDKIAKLGKNTNLSEVDKVRLTDYKTNLSDLNQKDLDVTKQLNSIQALSR